MHLDGMSCAEQHAAATIESAEAAAIGVYVYGMLPAAIASTSISLKIRTIYGRPFSSCSQTPDSNCLHHPPQAQQLPHPQQHHLIPPIAYKSI